MPATRTALGTNGTKTATTAWTALTSITLAAGDTLIVGVSSNAAGPGPTPTSVTWNGNALNQRQTAGGSNSTVGQFYDLPITSGNAGTGSIVVNYSTTTWDAAALFAIKVAGLTSSPYDVSSGGTGPSGTVVTNSTATTAQADEFLISFEAEKGVSTVSSISGDTPTAGQRGGTTGGSATSNATINEYYGTQTAIGTRSATYTMSASRVAVALIATYKVAPSNVALGTASASASATASGTLATTGARTFSNSGVPSNYLSSTTLPLGTTASDFTHVIWVKPAASPSGAMLALGDVTGTEVLIQRSFDGYWNVFVYDTGSSLNVSTSRLVSTDAGTWVCAALRRSSNAVTLWVDGTSYSIGTVSGTTNPSSFFKLGARSESSGAPLNGSGWNGDLAHYACWNRALSDSEITGMASGDKSPDNYPVGLKAHFPLKKTGTTETDTVGGLTLTQSGNVGSVAGPGLTTNALFSTTRARAAYVTSLSPLAYWRLNEDSGDFLDSSGNSRALTATGTLSRYAPVTISKPPDITEYGFGSADFAAGGYGTRSAESWSDIAGELTLEGWIYTRGVPSPAANQTVIRQEGGMWICYIGVSGDIAFGQNRAVGGYGGDVAGPVLPTYQWCHVAITRDADGKTVRFYLDGVLTHTRQISSAPVASSGGAIVLGQRVSGEPIKGGLSEFSVYNKTLPLETIRQLARAGVSPAAGGVTHLKKTELRPTISAFNAGAIIEQDHTVGPFKSAAGNYYYVPRSQSTHGLLVVVKNSTGNLTSDTDWKNDVGFPGAKILPLNRDGGRPWIRVLRVVQQNDLLHIAMGVQTLSPTEDGFGSYWYGVFNMATDTWSVQLEPISLTHWSEYQPYIGLAVRSTGEPVVAFVHDRGDGTREVLYSRKTGGAWTTPVVAIPYTTAVSFESALPVLGTSDRVHIFGTGNEALYERTLSASNVLETATQTLRATNSYYVVDAQTEGTETRVLVKGASSGQAAATVKFTSADTPSGFTTNVIGLTGYASSGFLVYDSGTWYAVVNDVLSSDSGYVYLAKDTGSGWSTPTAIVSSNVRCLTGNVFTIGGVPKLVYVAQPTYQFFDAAAFQTKTLDILFNGALSATATTAGALTTQIRAAAAVSASATVTGALTTQTRFAAAVNGTATSTAALTTELRLAGALSGTATVVSPLTTTIQCASAVSGTATVTGALTTDIRCAAAVTGTATPTADLTTAIQCAGAVSASATASGTLITPLLLAASVSTSTTTTGALTTAITAAAALSATATPTAGLTTAVLMTAAVAGAATVTSDLSVRRRFYFASTGSAAVSPTINAGAEWEHANTLRLPMRLTLGSTALAQTTYTPDAADHLVDNDALVAQFVSADQLNAQTIPAQTVKLQIQGLEAHANNNLFLTWKLFVVSADGTTVRGTLLDIRRAGTELATALTNRGDSATTTSLAVSGGDRLVLELGVGGTPGNASGTQGHNATLQFGESAASGDLPEDNSTTTATYRPWLELTSGYQPYVAAIEIAASVAAAATTTAGITTGILVASAVAGAATTVGALTTQITAAAAVAGAGTVSGALTTQILSAGALSATATAAGVLTVGARLDAALSASATTSAALTAQIQLAAAVSTATSTAGALTTQVTAAAALTATGTVAGDLTTEIRCAGALSAAATTAGDLATRTQFAAAISSSGTATATFAGDPAALAADVSGTAATSADLATVVQCAGALSSAATGAADLTTAILLEGALAGAATATADVTATITLAADLAGTGTTAGELTTAVWLAAEAASSGTSTALLDTTITLHGTSAASAAIAADLTTAITLAGDLTVSATLAGAFALLPAEFLGDLLAAALVEADLTTTAPIEAAVWSTADAAATLLVPILLEGALVGGATLEASPVWLAVPYCLTCTDGEGVALPCPPPSTVCIVP